MGLKAGIVGLPNVGKSTLFNAITNSKVEAANYPFATIEPNVGIVNLNDIRLEKLAKIVKTKKIIPATFEFIDIAGLVKGASKGEGLGNKFLANIRESDAIIQVVRCFEDENITHISTKIDPLRDIEIINLELLLSDISIVETIARRVGKKAVNSSDKDIKAEYQVLQMLQENFDQEIFARQIIFSADQLKIIKNYNLLTMKPILYIANVHENFVANPGKSKYFDIVNQYAQKQGLKCLGISIKIEQELSELEGEDKQMFLDDLGIQESGLDRLIFASFDLLSLATYFTAGIQEVRAWVFKKGMSAPKCAGIIHTDFEKGFIRAEVISYLDYIKYTGEIGAKEHGKARLEGKTYLMRDGDICHFRFNV